jgi:peptidoglycan/LPS O-acetylase OafA/YrhL
VGSLRFLLALSVLVTHSPSGLLAGVQLLPAVTAVQAFYIISGFLITMILNERKEYRSLRNFYSSRYLRLWPTYVVVAAMSLAFIHPTLLAELWKENVSTIALVMFANLTLFFQDWFLFLQLDHGTLGFTANFHDGAAPQFNRFLLVPQAWTLGIELTFYLIAPFVCRRWTAVAGLFVFGLAVRVAIGVWQPPYDPWLYRFAPAEMTLFAAGGLSYFLGRWAQARLPHAVMKYGPALCLLILVLAIVTVPPINMAVRNILGKSFWPVLWLTLPGFLLAVALMCPMLFHGWRKVGIDVVLGELSYPIYISHIFVFEVLWRTVPESLLAGNLLYVAATVAFSGILLVVVGLPVDRIRSRYGARVPGIVKIEPSAPFPAATVEPKRADL